MAATKKTTKKTAVKKTAAKKPAAKSLKAGDKVTWGSSGGKSVGKVVKKTTTTTKVKGHTAKASAEKPEYVVQSDKSGKQAVHKPEELKKTGK